MIREDLNQSIPSLSAFCVPFLRLQHRQTTMARTFDVSPPLEGDAARIAAIHLAAMESNPLLHAQFPTPESLGALHDFLEAYTVEQLPNPQAGILVARDSASGQVASFARWDYPSVGDIASVKIEASDLKDAHGCRPEFLDGYALLAEEARARCFGETACYSECPRRTLGVAEPVIGWDLI